MKIGVISDTHGHEQRFALAVEKFFDDADIIMHAGDVLYHGPRNPMLADYNPAKLAERINACNAQVIIARGNCDSDVDQLVLNSPIQAPYAYVFANGRRIVMTHGTHFTYCNDPSKPDWSKMIDEIAKQANTLRADIFITGHIHNNILERHGQSILLNPGSPSLPNRSDRRATVAAIDDAGIKIFDLDAGDELMSYEF
ncbi:MAG: phosphodiesterase [Selenomonadaceae bacterium]|nr:phosphodiesterase [Selenomonadaceae bacterium]